MSNTPRTDKIVYNSQPGNPTIPNGCFVVPASFARELETENAALRADKERLDWLESTMGCEGDRDHPFYKRIRLIGAALDDGDTDTVRDAMDKARGVPYRRPSLDHYDY